MIPSELQNRDKWVCWRFEGGPDRDKPDKVPVAYDNPSGGRVNAYDAINWTGIETARETARNHKQVDGIGFTFNSGGPILGIDLDNCRDKNTGEIDPWARNVIHRLDSYTEVSPSGTGVHIIADADMPGKRNRSGDVEIYDGGRFFTVTGDHLEGTPESVNEAQQAVDVVHDEWVADDDGDGSDGHTTPQTSPNEAVELGDQGLIEKAKDARNGDQFRRVWEGDYSHQDSHSEARLELYNYLAFWTGKDAKRMWRLFKQSDLYPHPQDTGKCERLKHKEIEKAKSDTANTYDSGFYDTGVGSDVADGDSRAVALDGGRSDQD